MSEITPASVRQLFLDAWPNRAPPDVLACAAVATSLGIVQAIPDRRMRRPAPVLGIAEKYARLFIKHLESDRERLEERLAHGEWDTVMRAHGSKILASLIGSDEHVRALLDGSAAVWEADSQLLQSKRAPAMFVAKAAKEAWQRSGALVPHSANSGDPLCIFVTAALAVCGFHHSTATVSDILRGRDERRRTGRTRAQIVPKTPRSKTKP